MAELRESQAAAARQISRKPTLLIADVGAGKTATALTAYDIRCKAFGLNRILVLGTVRICDSVWPAEVAKWTPQYRYASVAGLHPKLRKEIMEDGSIDLIGLNFDNLMWAVTNYRDQLPAMFPWLLIDESSKLENPASKSFRAIRSLLPGFKWRLAMTGTPRANHLQDLWGNAYLADLGEALGKHKEAFLQKWFRCKKGPFGTEWVPKYNAENQILSRLKGSTCRMPFVWKEAVEIDIILPLHPEVERVQAAITQQLKVSPDAVLNGITFARKGARVKAKMIQLSSGSVYDDDCGLVHYHSAKMQALQDLVAEAHGEPMMVVYQFQHERDAILAQFKQARLLDNDDTLAEWNAGGIEMLLVHPESCGHGVNAQLSNAALQIWYSPTDDAELYTQTVGRLNRPGNLNTVRVVRLIMKGTKDLASYMVIEARRRGEIATIDMFD